MNIFVDSSYLIEVLGNRKALDSSCNYFINPIVYSEVLYGLLYIKKTEEAFKKFLSLNNIDLLVIDQLTSSIYTNLKLDLFKKGKPLPDNDLLIAATCLEYSIPLLTLNKKHFKRIDKLNLL